MLFCAVLGWCLALLIWVGVVLDGDGLVLCCAVLGWRCVTLVPCLIDAVLSVLRSCAAVLTVTG